MKRNLDRFKKTLDDTVLKDIDATEEEKRKLLASLHTPKKTKRNPLVYYAGFSAAALLLLILSLPLIMEFNGGTSRNDSTASLSGEAGEEARTENAELSEAAQDSAPQEVITDSDTEKWLGIVEPGPDMLVETVGSDGMDQGKHEFSGKEIVIDPDYYSENGIKRGDIVYFDIPMDKLAEDVSVAVDRTISRVVGLPGETVKIVDGQLYINGKKLDTFYSKAMSRGHTKETYPGDGLGDYFEMDMAEIQVPENHVFLFDDTWWRGFDSQDFGTLPTEAIVGKVLGYTNYDPSQPAFTSIEVREWESDELVKEITNKEFLEEFDEQLIAPARDSYTEMESNPPDYRLLFQQGNETLWEAGYYKEAIEAGEVKGRYLGLENHKSFQEQKNLYGITLDLPVK